MPLPNITVITSDNASAVGSSGLTDTFAYIGVSTGGTPNTVYSFTNIKDLVATLISGPLVDCVALALSKSANAVYCIPANCDIVSIKSAVSIGVGNTSVGTLTLTGTPLDQFQGIVKITSSGIVGVSTFKVSLDNGVNYSQELLTAATYSIPGSGLTLNFGAGNYVANDSFTFTTTMPSYTYTNLNSALDTLISANIYVNKIHIIGVIRSTDDTASCSAAFSIASAVDVRLSSLEGNFKYCCAIMDGADISNNSTADGLLSTAALNIIAPRVMFCQGFGQIVSPVSGKILRRPVAWAISSLIRSLPYGQSPHCPVRGALQLVSIERDEQMRPGLDNARITTVRTIPGQQGFYISRPWMLSSPTSDFKYSYNKSIMDRAREYTIASMGKYLNEQFNTNLNGTLTARSRDVIEKNVSQVVGGILETENAITPNTFTAVVDPAVNIITTETLKVTIRFQIKGTASYIIVDIGFQPTTTVGK